MIPYRQAIFMEYLKGMISFKVNSESVTYEGDDDTPLLWVLRDHLQKTGTKYGCGIGQCGACTVHVNGRAQRSCITPVSTVSGQSITTIEGLASSDGELHPVQKAWLEIDVPQCGYCQAGQIMATADFKPGRCCGCCEITCKRRAPNTAVVSANAGLVRCM